MPSRGWILGNVATPWIEERVFGGIRIHRNRLREARRDAGCQEASLRRARARGHELRGGRHAAAEADGPQVPEHGRAHIHRRRAGVRPEHVGHRLPARAQQVDRLPRGGAQPRSGHRALHPLQGQRDGGRQAQAAQAAQARGPKARGGRPGQARRPLEPRADFPLARGGIPR